MDTRGSRAMASQDCKEPASLLQFDRLGLVPFISSIIHKGCLTQTSANATSGAHHQELRQCCAWCPGR